MKITLFKTVQDKKPLSTTTLQQFLEDIKDGKWKKEVLTLRAKNSIASFKAAKIRLPGVTVSGNFLNRDSNLPLNKKLKEHSGYIAIDVDLKDNPNLRAHDLVDKDAVAQFVSCSGKGKKIIYACTKVKTAEEHRRIYDACAERLAKLDIKLNIDPIVKKYCITTIR
jgi:hypothetical protein